MTRKGELSPKAIDTGWPHQVALPAEDASGGHHVTTHDFCRGLSLCHRGHAFRRNDCDYVVFCFADRDHAELFQERFGGEFIAQKDRPKWGRS